MRSYENVDNETRLKDILAGTSTQKDIANITAALIAGGGDPATAAADAIRIFLQIQGALGVDLKADGGRAGYQVGGEVIEDVAMMTETMPAPGPTAPAQTQDLTYDELRSRLPREITDDVVTLISTSKQALTDFANIQTQQDVDNFNKLYNVNLVLPQEG